MEYDLDLRYEKSLLVRSSGPAIHSILFDAFAAIRIFLGLH